MKDGVIRPNFGDIKSTWYGKNYYYCQKRKAISLLDLKRADRAILFKESDWNFQNWLGVFEYHKPSLALFLDLKDDERDLFYLKYSKTMYDHAMQSCVLLMPRKEEPEPAGGAYVSPAAGDPSARPQ